MASKHLLPEQQNFVRLSLACVDEIRKVLGDILHSQIPSENLLREIQANTTLLTGHQKLTPEQLKLCYIPGPVVPDYRCFDITLLYKLIRYLCSTLQPTQGWGKKPHQTDIKLGDDIERLRLFRNDVVAHAQSSSVPDDVFNSKWNELRDAFNRIYGFPLLNRNKTGILDHLACIEKTDFGWQEYEKSQLRLALEHIKLTEAPKLTLEGDERKSYGESSCFVARYGNVDMSNNWPITWQIIRGNTTEQLDIGTERYRGSSSQMLVIARVSKEDQGEYRATVSREVNGTHVQIPSNSIYFTVTGDLPILEIEKAISEDDRITIHYNVSVDDQSPAVHSILWTKDGTRLDTNADKYSGGQFIDRHFTIHSPTSTDIGQYSCEVFNAVGSVTKSIDLNIPSVSIVGNLQVTVGNAVTIKGIIQSCPTRVSAIWQKNGKLDLEDFENLDIDDSKYLGSKNDPEHPILVIPKTTHEDEIYYRLVVSNGMGQGSSNAICLELIGDVPSLYVHHETNVLEKSVTLVCKMALPINSPEVSDVFWTKDDIKIDILGREGKYSGGSIVDPSLTIKTVNSNDKGRYQCCVSNLMGKMRSEKIHLGLPTIEFDNPDLDELHERVTYNAAIKSIPVALRAEWKVRQEPSGDLQALDTHNPLHRGSTVALPRPRLVVNRYTTEQLQSFQLEVFNFIGSSRRDTYDKIMDSSESNIDQVVSDPLRKLYNKRGSTVLFANLTDKLAKSIPEDKLDVLKHILLGLSEVDSESIKKVKSIRELFILLQENKLFTQTDVIFMQYLLKRIECKDLNEECIKYARKQIALCFFEKFPDDGSKHVQIHVAGHFEVYLQEDIQKIRETVVAILGCEDSDVVIDGIRRVNSFFVVLAIKEIFVNNIVHMDQQHIQKLCHFKVDYFILDNEKYSMESLLKARVHVSGAKGEKPHREGVRKEATVKFVQYFQRDDHTRQNLYSSISFDPATLQRPLSIHSIRSLKRAQSERKNLTDDYKEAAAIEEISDGISEHGGCIECVKVIPVIWGEEIEEGDHIVFAEALYDHHGIVISKKKDGNEIEIVEATNTIFGAIAGIFIGKKAHVQRTIKTFNFTIDHIRIVVYRKPKFSKQEIVCRAKTFINKGEPNRKNFDYNILTNNCEHFATFCVTGKRFSILVRKFVMIASIFVRRGFLGISDEKLRNEKEFENNIICKQCYEVNKKLFSAEITPILRHDDVNLGDVIRYSYWNLWHDAVVLRIVKKDSKFVLCEIAHYCYCGPFSQREIIREELKIDFKGSVSVLHYEPPNYDVYDPEVVVHRAEQRMEEKCFVFFSNDSSHYARWCKLKLVRQSSMVMETAV
ncbi:uncharacterized protein LOC130048042 [Ostrea edulis]|uniref:uncharacterized protein LOC130048042 n=1 Tax=Ostrea edulis TaxID=37623 RepID=UPI0024AED136|nr:uncharacterized protein LOC130048042 [Ostrea edulis]XP_056000009.1 uncharacterized protein LOC130048042 [Ostrea edulis]XP_056000010.1 uncharacterized protein LOC130048042 [Ostrea edulis]XP_056000011.1 uncharacterized protein LOC130048042 [Ostrea edulis]